MPRALLRNFFVFAAFRAAVSSASCLAPHHSPSSFSTLGGVSKGHAIMRERSTVGTSSLHPCREHHQRLSQGYGRDQLLGVKLLQPRSPRPADSGPPSDYSSVASDASGSGSGKQKKNEKKKATKATSKTTPEQPQPQASAPDAPDVAAAREIAQKELKRQRNKPYNAVQTKKLSGFLSLRAARLWLLGPTPAHIDRLGAYRALTDMWVEYDATVKQLRRRQAQAAKLPPDAAAALQPEMAQMQETLSRLSPFVNVRRKYARYMAKLAGVIRSTSRDADIAAVIDQSVAKLRQMGYNLPAKAAEVVPPEEMAEALAEAEAAQAAALVKEGTMRTLRQEWEGVVDKLVREAMEHEASTGTSWLQRHDGLEAKRRYLLSHDSLLDVLQRIRAQNPDNLPTLTRTMEERLKLEINRAFTQCVSDGYPDDLEETCRVRWTFITAERRHIKPAYSLGQSLRIKHQVRVNEAFLACLKEPGKSYDECMRESEREYKGILFRPRAPDQPPPLQTRGRGRPSYRKAESGDEPPSTSPSAPPPSSLALGEHIRSAMSLMRQNAASGIRNYFSGGATPARSWRPPPPARPARIPWQALMRHP